MTQEQCGAVLSEERPSKLLKKSLPRRFTAILSRAATPLEAGASAVERPQMKLHICIAFLLKVTADREARRVPHQHTHTHISGCYTVMLFVFFVKHLDV